MKLKRYAISLFAASMLFVNTVHSELAPTPLSGDARMVEFDYNNELIYLVLTRPLAVTNIVMPQGERIKLLKAGDTFSFQIEASKVRDEIFIKPKFEGIETTMTVVTTNKRFQFVIRSTGANKKYYQQVSFAEERNTMFEFDAEAPEAYIAADKDSELINSKDFTRVNPADLNTKYTISGSAKFKPEVVYDNGKFIWLKFPQNLTEMPAIFAKDAQGMYLVNYIPDRNNVVIIQQIVDELLLKIDEEEVIVKRGKKGFFGWSN